MLNFKINAGVLQKMSLESSTTEEGASSPTICSESRGSSVSTEMREEYEDLLRYAVVMPTVGNDAANTAFPTIPSPSKVVHPKPTSARSGPPTPQPAPPRPQVTILDLSDSEESSISLGPVPQPLTPQVPPIVPTAADLSQSVSLRDTLDTPLPPFHEPFTAMNVRDHVTSTAMSTPRSRPDHEELVKPSVSWRRDQVPYDDSNDSSATFQPPMADPERNRLSNKLDVWCLDLRKNILAEFEQSRLRLIECQLVHFRKESEKQAYKLQQTRAELERYKELLLTYEQSIGRKDHIITNLTRTMQKQKEKTDLQRTFCSWKLRHVDDKRKEFTSALALGHHCLRVKGHVFRAWFGIIQGKWRHRVEKACQMKAQEVCMELTGQYEDKLASMHSSLEACRVEVEELTAQRDLQEENMKKAFMRGVCALNMEAMTVFKRNDDEITASTNCDADIPLYPCGNPGHTHHAPPTPPVIIMAEGNDVQKAQLAHAKRNLLPRTITDMRPMISIESLTKSKRAQITCTTVTTTAHSQAPPTSSQAPMSTSVLSSKMHHQHIMNRGQMGPGVLGSGYGARLGGTPAVFVQKHSDN